jgi:hypothetical protein
MAAELCLERPSQLLVSPSMLVLDLLFFTIELLTERSDGTKHLPLQQQDGSKLHCLNNQLPINPLWFVTTERRVSAPTLVQRVLFQQPPPLQAHEWLYRCHFSLTYLDTPASAATRRIQTALFEQPIADQSTLVRNDRATTTNAT